MFNEMENRNVAPTANAPTECCVPVCGGASNKPPIGEILKMENQKLAELLMKLNQVETFLVTSQEPGPYEPPNPTCMDEAVRIGEGMATMCLGVLGRIMQELGVA